MTDSVSVWCSLVVRRLNGLCKSAFIWFCKIVLLFLDSKTVRLLDGEHSQNGNVILYYNGHWGRVCGVYWHPDEAVVACRQLGYNSLVQSYSTQWPSINARRIRRQYDVKCNGSESSLLKCSVYRDLYGNHREQASITCCKCITNATV